MAFAYRIVIVSSGVPMGHATSARDLAIRLTGPNAPSGQSLPGGIKKLWQLSEFPGFGQVPLARRRPRPVERCFHGSPDGQPRGIRL